MSRNFTAGHRPPPVPSGNGIGAKLRAILKAPASWSWKGRIAAIAVLLAGLAGAAFATGNQDKIPYLDKIPMPFASNASDVAEDGEGAADRADDERGNAKARARAAKRGRRAGARGKVRGKRNKDRKLTAAQKKRRAARARKRRRARNRDD